MRVPVALACLACAPLAACSFGGDTGDAVKVSFSADSAARAVSLGPGEVSVTSTDTAITLTLVGDTVRFQLADAVRRSARAQVDSGLGKEAGAFGRAIAGSVSKIVEASTGFVVRIPVQQMRDVRYTDGMIRFETTGDGKFSMGGEGDRAGGKGQFTPEDGERFVAAVKARQQALGQRREGAF